mmetsp:Transcript_6419/g.19825  ORF Transcript_6419/g.19825 Transcript_6419/m.19825 type:complete len:212 (+) Transcript_6419:358-993(+)
MPTSRTTMSGPSTPPARRSTRSTGSGPATLVRMTSGASLRTGTRSGATSIMQARTRSGRARWRRRRRGRPSRCACASPSSTSNPGRCSTCRGASGAAPTRTCASGGSPRSGRSPTCWCSRTTSSSALAARTPSSASRTARSSRRGSAGRWSLLPAALTSSIWAGLAGGTATTGIGSSPEKSARSVTSTSGEQSMSGRRSRTCSRRKGPRSS